jgi:hypothetical protein
MVVDSPPNNLQAQQCMLHIHCCLILNTSNVLAYFLKIRPAVTFRQTDELGLAGDVQGQGKVLMLVPMTQRFSLL